MRGLTSFQLKCIAVVTMVIDHIGAILYPGDLIFRYIGRIAFPIFCFLLVEGFFHTHDRIQYMIRLGIFAILSEIPYDLAFRNQTLEFTRQNVYFTLLLGVLMMCVLSISANWPERIMILLLFMWAGEFLKADYGFRGILLIFIYYLSREAKLKTDQTYAIGHKTGLLTGALWNFLWKQKAQWYGVAASIPIGLYNGERGRNMKYFFYLFYPLHLLVLYMIHRYIVQ